MTELHCEYCLICQNDGHEDLSCLISKDGCELSEVGLLFQELLQIVVYVNETRLYLCSTCSQKLKDFHEFKKKSIEAYSNLMELSRRLEQEIDSATHKSEQANISNSLNGSFSKGDNVRVEEVSVFNINSEKTEQFQIKYIEEDDGEMNVSNSSDLLQPSKLKEVRARKKTCIQCKKCNEVFESTESLKNHMELHVEPSKCDFCSVVFWDNKQYNEHLYRHIKHGPPYQCKRCPQVYQDKKYFIEHLTFHVFGLKCEKCHKMFYRKNLLQVHMRTTHAPERRYVCRTCGKRFKSSSHLRNHNYSHMGKKFQCPSCPNRYSTPRTLRDHFKSVHGSDLTFSCEVCEQLFLTKDELLKHIRNEHVVNVTNDDLEMDLGQNIIENI